MYPYRNGCLYFLFICPFSFFSSYIVMHFRLWTWETELNKSSFTSYQILTLACSCIGVPDSWHNHCITMTHYMTEAMHCTYTCTRIIKHDISTATWICISTVMPSTTIVNELKPHATIGLVHVTNLGYCSYTRYEIAMITRVPTHIYLRHSKTPKIKAMMSHTLQRPTWQSLRVSLIHMTAIC